MLKPVLVKKKLNKQKFRKEAEQYIRKFNKQVETDFVSSFKDWKHKPVFENSVNIDGDTFVSKNATDDKIYTFVSEGTKRHFVGPKKAKALRFKTKYSAKTKKGRLQSTSGGASGPVGFSKGHYVKGIKARKFDLLVKKKREKEFIVNMKVILANSVEE